MAESDTMTAIRADWLSRTIPLLPRHDIRLMAWQGDGERFARQFIETWKLIPLAARRRMLALWKSFQANLPFCPFLELLDDWSTREVKAGLSTAQVAMGGRQIRFHAGEFAEMPDGACRWIIAHELAHVLQLATGREMGDDDSDEREWVEMEADEIAEEFDEFRRKWLKGAGGSNPTA
jgi:hypothetical protein